MSTGRLSINQRVTQAFRQFFDFIDTFAAAYNQPNDESLWLKSMKEVEELENITDKTPTQKEALHQFQLLFACYLLNLNPKNALKYTSEEFDAMLAKRNDKEKADLKDAYNFIKKWQAAKPETPENYPDQKVIDAYKILINMQQAILDNFKTDYRWFCQQLNPKRDPNPFLGAIATKKLTTIKSISILASEESDDNTAKNCFAQITKATLNKARENGKANTQEIIKAEAEQKAPMPTTPLPITSLPDTIPSSASFSEPLTDFPTFVADFCRIYQQNNDRSLWLNSMDQINQIGIAWNVSDSDKKIFHRFQFLYACYLLNQQPENAALISPALVNQMAAGQEYSKSNSAVLVDSTPTLDSEAIKFIEEWQSESRGFQNSKDEIAFLQARIDTETLSAQDKSDLQVRITSLESFLPQNLFSPKSGNLPTYYAALRTEQDAIMSAFMIIYKAICAGCNRDSEQLLKKFNTHNHTEKSLFDLVNQANDKGIAKEAFKLAQEHYTNLDPKKNRHLVTCMYQKAFACSTGLKRSKVISPFTFYRSSELDVNFYKRDISAEMITMRLQPKYQKTRLGKMLKVMVDSQPQQPEQRQENRSRTRTHGSVYV